MSLVLYTNNARTTLASPITSTALTLTVVAGTGAIFPSPTGLQYFRATIVNATNSAIFENIKVTSVSTDTFTIVRGQEGTANIAWSTGALVNLYITAADMQSFAQLDDLQAQPGNYATDTGSVNAYAVSLTPALTSHIIGMPIRWKAASTNTSSSTFNDGAGTGSLLLSNGNALLPGMIVSGSIYTSTWNGATFQVDGSSFLMQPTEQTFTLTGGQTVISLSIPPISLASTLLIIDGASLTPGVDFTLAGSTITLAVGATGGQTAVVYYTVASFVFAPAPGTVTDASLASGSVIYQIEKGFIQTPVEFAKGITPTNFSFGTGSIYRYGAKGGAGRTADAVITGTPSILTSASNGFTGAQVGMVAVVVDGGALRTGGRPAPLITTITAAAAGQITLNTSVIAPATVTMNGTLNGTTSVTSTSVNPITAGVGLTRTWKVTGTNIPGGTTITATGPTTLTLSVAALGSGVSALTLTAPIEVCFGWDDSAAINAALSLPYPITDVKDNFLTTLPMTIGGAGCNNISLPSALIIFAINNNTSHCVTAVGLDRGNLPIFDGIRYLPFRAEFGELECCNTGLAGTSLGPSMSSIFRARINNPFRSAFEEFFLSGGWQEGNYIYIDCGHVGLHFHHKVSKSSTYQTLGSYQIRGRSSGLNSVYLGINATTQPDQCGGGVRLYAGGGATADGGMSQNVWGAQAFCELDGQRVIALSFGSDISNSPVIFVDASAAYVIEGAASAAFSNIYRSNVFQNMAIEDISQGADTRGGYQYYAMSNATVQSTTVMSSSTGPWGQTYANNLMLNGADNFIRWVQRLSFQGLQLIPNGSGNLGALPIIQGGSNGVAAAPPLINAQDYNNIVVGTSLTTLVTGDNNQMFFIQDASGGGGAIGFMTTSSTVVTLLGSTLSGLTLIRTATVGLQASVASGTRTIRVIALASGS